MALMMFSMEKPPAAFLLTKALAPNRKASITTEPISLIRRTRLSLNGERSPSGRDSSLRGLSNRPEKMIILIEG